MLKSLVEWLKGIFGAKAPVEPTVEADPEGGFPSVSPDQLGQELNVVKLGKENGAKNKPKTGSEDYDEVEASIVKAVETIRDRELRIFKELQTSNENFLVNAHRIPSEVMTVAGQATSRFMTAESRILNSLEIIKESYIQARKSAQEFEEDVGRPPHFGNGWMSYIFLVVIILVLESAMNGYFFGQASEQGWLGGIMIAVGIAVVNIGIATITGKIWCYFNHNNFLWKILVFILIWPLLAGIAAINKLAAHYREETGNADSTESATQAALLNFRSDPLSFEQIVSFESWMLISLGLLFAVITVYKAYHISDPYPGYEKVASLADKYAEEYSEMYDEAMEDIEEQRDLAIKALNDLTEDYQQKLELANRLLGTSNVYDVRKFVAGCDKAINLVLELYRSENAAHRTTAAPKRFSEKYKSDINVDIFILKMDANKIVKETNSKLGPIILKYEREIQSSYRKAINSVKNLSEINEQQDLPARAKRKARS